MNYLLNLKMISKMNPKELQRVANMIKAIDSGAVQPDELAKVIKVIGDVIKNNYSLIQQNINNEVLSLKNDISKVVGTIRQLENKTDSAIGEVSGKAQQFSLSEVSKMASKLESDMAKMHDMMPEMPDITSLETRITELENEEEMDMEEELPKYGVQVRDSLELLQNDERLDIKAIKGIDKLEKSIEKLKGGNIQMYGGGRGIDISIDGTNKGLTKYVNLIGGTGVTLSTTIVGERTDITITASSSALTILTATGTIDNSNKVFTFVSTPTLVIVNGTAYRNGYGVTIVTTTATLEQPVGVGGDIYALG